MRRLIVCCDGTWNRADWQGGTATNVIRLARAIKPNGNADAPDDSKIPQMVYYHPGVGTGNRLDRLLGGSVGLGLSQNVRDAYAFIVNNYVPGDQIFLIGFSRGAFTARTLGGLIGTVGLLLKGQMGAFLDAWAYHRLSPSEREKRVVDFDAHFPGRRTDVPIQCIAVWDTVGALGIPRNRLTGRWQPCKDLYRFHDTQLGSHVRHAFQALALDEMRSPFVPVAWTRNPLSPSAQVLKQMWFAGAHSDVGGGYGDHGASDVALLWIASELSEHNLLDLEASELTSQLDRRERYGRGRLHNSLTFFYKILSGRRYRKVSLSPDERIHATVAHRVIATGYRTPKFLARHIGQVQPLSPFEERLGGYTAAPFKLREPFLREMSTFCERLVRWLMG